MLFANKFYGISAHGIVAIKFFLYSIVFERLKHSERILLHANRKLQTAVLARWKLSSTFERKAKPPENKLCTILEGMIVECQGFFILSNNRDHRTERSSDVQSLSG